MKLNNLIENKKGFTLIELIGGIIITGFAVGVIYCGYLGISALKKYANKPVVERANVCGGPEDELFIDKGTKRFYAEIDGKSVEGYLNKNKQ